MYDENRTPKTNVSVLGLCMITTNDVSREIKTYLSLKISLESAFMWLH